MFGEPLMSFDYVSTMYLGKNKVGYAQRKFAENFVWLIERERYFPPENVKKRQIFDLNRMKSFENNDTSDFTDHISIENNSIDLQIFLKDA